MSRDSAVAACVLRASGLEKVLPVLGVNQAGAPGV